MMSSHTASQLGAINQSDSRTAGAYIDQLRRLGRLLDEETESLLTGQHLNLTATIHQKGLLLMQLDESQTPREPEAALELAALRGKLSRNRAALEVNFRALQDLNDVLTESQRQSESDGTYSRRARQPGL